MRRRVAALLSILTAAVAVTLVGVAPAWAATMCPYTVSQSINTYYAPRAGEPSTGRLNAGTVYYFSSPLVTSGSWVQYRTHQWIHTTPHRTSGQCRN